MKKSFTLPVLFLLFAAGYKSVQAAIINAATCSQTDVQAAVNSAANGDVVQVPAGTCTWNTAVVIPDNKKITLQGAGKTLTVITMSSNGWAFMLGESGSRITGFGFKEGQIRADGNNFRIDHCSLYFAAWSDAITAGSQGIIPTATPAGLIDNNELTRARILIMGTNCMLNDPNCGTAQDKLWSMPPVLGDEKAIYVEANTYDSDCFGNVIDMNYGGAYVFRFNTINDHGSNSNSGQYIESHSVQGLNRSGQRWEIYNNTIDNTGANIFEPFRLRGGTGVVFNNSVKGNWTNYEIALDNVRSRTDEGPFPQGHCNGASNWDQNLPGQSGCHCRDQVGVGYDATLWDHTTPGVWNQVLMPVYGWNNKRSDGVTDVPFNQIGDDIGNAIQENRDYYNYVSPFTFNGTVGLGVGTLANRPSTCTVGVGYWAADQGNWNKSGSGGQGVLYKCTATNTWTKYYTPLCYPHPLASGITCTNTTATPSLPDADQQIKIYPNPSSRIFNVQWLQASAPSGMNNGNINTLNIEVYSVLGEKLLEKRIDSQTEKMMDVSSLPSGIYFIQLSNATLNSKYKIVIAR